MSANQSLNVFYEEQCVGKLSTDDTDRWHFRYTESWLDRRDSWAISEQLPLLQETFSNNEAHVFFSNLLPEGPVRVALCQRLQISLDNDFELLKAIGGECAGAVSLSSSNDKIHDNRQDYHELSEELLNQYMEDPIAWARAEEDVRLSLAGAQNKIPVFATSGKLYLPVHGSPSTHILKFANPRFAHMPENEALTMQLATEVGLKVPRVEWMPKPYGTFILVERYDRLRTDNKVVRIHQEDFCQALGYVAMRKYENEGGPSFAQCARLLMNASSQPLADVTLLLRWLAFNVLIGNADAHAKNISLVRGRTVHLAPIYDLVCTHAYPKLSKNLAMAVHGVFDASRLRRRHIEGLANDLMIKSGALFDEFDRTGEMIIRALENSRKKTFSHPAQHAVREMIVPLILKRVKKISRQLGQW